MSSNSAQWRRGAVAATPSHCAFASVVEKAAALCDGCVVVAEAMATEGARAADTGGAEKGEARGARAVVKSRRMPLRHT